MRKHVHLDLFSEVITIAVVTKISEALVTVGISQEIDIDISSVIPSFRHRGRVVRVTNRTCHLIETAASLGLPSNLSYLIQ